MINHTFQSTVTLYHQSKHFDEETKRNVTLWTRTVHENCYFGTQDEQALNGTTLSVASSYTARIPYQGEKIHIGAGDIAVLGEVNDDIADIQGKRTTDLLTKYKPDCFTVRVCRDNTKIKRGAHYKLMGV